MKILLQHARTRLYFKGLGDWTANPLEAFDFKHLERAIKFARSNNLSGVQIAVKFLDRETDKVVPMPAPELPVSGLPAFG
jgi:hypothetical protein